MFVTSDQIQHSKRRVDMTLLGGLLEQKENAGPSMVGLPPLCTGADCDVKASLARDEIADRVDVIGIVTNASSSLCVYPSAAVAATSNPPAVHAIDSQSPLHRQLDRTVLQTGTFERRCSYHTTCHP